MDSPASPLPEARRVLEIARRDKSAAEKALSTLPLEMQVAVVCEAPAAQRARMLELVPSPEQVIPLLPEAELCFTVKAVGLDDATWILEYASESQLATCIDLDAWSGLEPDRDSLAHWFAVLAEAGEETLVRSAKALDPEVLVLFVRDRVHVMLDPNDEEWQAPEGAITLEGQFYFVARREGDDIAPLLELLHALFVADYWLYFRMMQAVIWELEPELEEWALRWRSGRLADLGFPEWEEAMRIYGFLRPEQRSLLAERRLHTESAAWDLPVWLPELPGLAQDEHAIFRAAGDLEGEDRRNFFYAFVALANKIAVADRMPLGDAETLPKAIAKAAEFASLGLEEVTNETGVAMSEVLQRASVDQLFRAGASIDPKRARPPLREEEDDDDDEQGDVRD
jgi:hypothetical protein